LPTLESGAIATPIDYNNTYVDTYANRSCNSPDFFELTPVISKKIKNNTSVQHTVERYSPYIANTVTNNEHKKYGTYKPMDWTKEVS